MLDHVHGANFIEDAVLERIWMYIQIAKHICRGAGDAVDPDCAGILVYPAANVEYPAPCSRWTTRRHSSSVSTAKSA